MPLDDETIKVSHSGAARSVSQRPAESGPSSSPDPCCSQCGVEPTGLVEVTQMEDDEPRYFPTGWPPGDHEHAIDPPSPSDLLDAGDRARERMLRLM